MTDDTLRCRLWINCTVQVKCGNFKTLLWFILSSLSPQNRRYLINFLCIDNAVISFTPLTKTKDKEKIKMKLTNYQKTHLLCTVWSWVSHRIWSSPHLCYGCNQVSSTHIWLFSITSLRRGHTFNNASYLGWPLAAAFVLSFRWKCLESFWQFDFPMTLEMADTRSCRSLD